MEPMHIHSFLPGHTIKPFLHYKLHVALLNYEPQLMDAGQSIIDVKENVDDEFSNFCYPNSIFPLIVASMIYRL